MSARMPTMFRTALRWRSAEARAPTTPRIDILVPVLLGATLLGAVLVLVGWQTGEAVLKAGAPGLSATQPLAAVGVIVATIGLWLQRSASPAALGLARGLGAALIAAALFVIVQNALDVDWGSDRLLFPDEVLTGQTGQFLRAGRPAGSALVAFIALGACLLSAPSRRAASMRIPLYCANFGLMGATAALLAYGLRISPLQAMGLYAQVSLPASLLLWLLFASALLMRKEQSCLGALLGDSIGAISGRSLLAWGACLLLVLIVSVQFASHAHWYHSELAVFLVTITGLILMSLGIRAHVRRLDGLESSRRAIVAQATTLQRQAAEARAASESALRDKADLVAALAHELRNLLAALAYATELLKHGAGALPTDLAPVVAMQERQVTRLKRILDEQLDRYDANAPSDQLRPPDSR